MRKKKRRYLQLLLKEEIVEGRAEHGLFSQRTRTALHDVLRILDKAAGDPSVAAIVVTLQDLEAGWARLSNIRRALARFRTTGKPVFCYLASGSNAEYYVASACSRILLGPAGSLHLVGLASEVFFFREALDKLGLQPQLEAVGEFKSAGEMFTRTGMSPAAREQWDALLDDYSREFCQSLAAGRGMTTEEMTLRINSGPYTPREALAHNLIDEVCYADEIQDKLNETLRGSHEPLHAGRYLARDGLLRRWVTWRRPQVGIVDVLGHIANGESRRDRMGRHVAGAETLGSFFEHARKSRRIRALVMRVDSPGGSGLASDVLWRKISLFAKEKPLVVSFGDVAASGGYYVSAPAALILAEPTSVTGSIGVLGGKVVARELMARLSVHRDSIRRGEHSEFDSLFAPFSAEETERLKRHLEEFYRENFVRKVAEGRKMSEQDVDRAGRGRVWSGARAAQQRLVDRMGGLDEAVTEARRLAGLPDKKKIRLVQYAKRRRLKDMLLPDFAPQFETAWLPPASADLVELLFRMAENAVLLLMPFQIRIR